MMDWAGQSINKVNQSRLDRFKRPIEGLDKNLSDDLLKKYHPDYVGKKRTLATGPNAGGLPIPVELADLLEADSPLPQDFEPSTDLETDVLIIGGGGAGTAAAIALQESGLKVHLATKLRLGDSNTVMAEGGIQASIGKSDSPRKHYADTFVGGHGENDSELLRYLCESGLKTIDWLTQLGCMFDRNQDGTYRLKSGGGTSTPRVLACRDITGLEIMRVLREAIRQGNTHLLENHSAVELLDDGNGVATGAVLWNSQTKKLISVSAKAILLASGGGGQLRFGGTNTSNHIGATGDGLVLAYRLGCALVNIHSWQYHPSGFCYPEALAGQLATEALRSLGAQILNRDGERFVDELNFRDKVAAAIIKECDQGKGVQTPSGKTGVWLDLPMVELKQGEGTLRKLFPGLVHRLERFDIKPEKDPILIYPTLHYQNGGIRVDKNCQTDVPGLWAAGETTGGLHGTNRLMGNSLLDIIVFGRLAGKSILENIPERKTITLTALKKFRQSLKNIPSSPVNYSPQLFPIESNWKMEIAKEEPNDQNLSNDNSSFGDTTSFEPPDPFAGRF
jgi:succinate dehydrogenase/fumarate reductase flavoprotein subunit